MEWVREPVDRSREVRLDFLIKLYFARQLGPDDVSALIGQQLEICRSTLDGLHTTLEIRENKESQPANNFSYTNDDDEDYGNKPKRSHPRPHEHERNRDLTPEEELFFRLVLEMRIKQNEAIIAWLESSRRELAGGYHY
jgi:hypothetical protein